MLSSTCPAYWQPGASHRGMNRRYPRMALRAYSVATIRGATISDIAIQTLDGRLVNSLVRGRRYKYTYRVLFSGQFTRIRFGMLIKSVAGYEFGGAASHPVGSGGVEMVESDSCWRASFVFTCNLAPGTYFLNAGVVGAIGEEETYLHRLIDASVFKVLPEKNLKMTGVVDFQIDSMFQCEFGQSIEAN